MTKGTTSRRGNTRSGTPRTIDLAASEVKATPPEPAAEADAPKGETPEAEPVAIDAAEPVRTDRPLTGLGATTHAKAEEPVDGKSTGTADNKEAAFTGQPFARETSAKPPSADKSSTGWGRDSETGPEGKKQAAKTPVAPSRGGGLVASLLSGLVGAVLALLLLGGLDTSGTLRHIPLLSGLASKPAPASVPDLSADVAALDKRIAALETSSRAAPANSDSSALSADVADMNSRLSAIEQRLNEQPAATPDGEASADVTARLADLTQRLDNLENASPAASGADPGLGDRLDTLQSQVQTLETSAKATSDRIDEIQARVDALRDKLAATSDESKIRNDKDQAARNVAIEALTAAYRRGDPFGDFLDALRKLTDGAPAVDALLPYASTGVATDSELIDGFDTASRQALGALAPKDEGVVSRLISNARSLVDVRPAGPVEGDEPSAVLSRVEADLANGDFPAALAEWQFLPAESRQAAAGWAGKLEKRVAADKALRGITAMATK